MEMIKKLLAILAELSEVVDIPGTELDGIALDLAASINRVLKIEQERTGKTREEVIAARGIRVDSTIGKLLEDQAKGE